MGIRRYLQHWCTGRGVYLQTAAFVPDTHPIRQWADTFPWEAMVHAVTQSFTRRFPKKRPTGGRPSVSPRVLLALELLKHELGESDDDVCQRLRTDVAVMYACGLREVHADHSQAHFVLPKKTPAPPRTPQHAVRDPGHATEDPRSGSPPDAAKGHAGLWPPMSGPRQSLRHAGASDRKAVA